MARNGGKVHVVRVTKTGYVDRHGNRRDYSSAYLRRTYRDGRDVGLDADAKLIGFYLVDGVIRAAVGLDRGGDPELDLDGEMAACARLVSARARPAPSVLADDRTDLWSLARA